MKNLKTTLFALVALLLANTAIQAKPVTTEDPIESAQPFSVTYLGSQGNYLVFQVVVKATDSKKASFEVSDKNEGVLYTTNVKAGVKVQTLKIEKINDQQLDFKAVINGNTYTKNFTVMETVSLEKK